MALKAEGSGLADIPEELNLPMKKVFSDFDDFDALEGIIQNDVGRVHADFTPHTAKIQLRVLNFYRFVNGDSSMRSGA